MLSFPVAGSKYSLSVGLDVVSFPVEGSKYRFSAALDVPRFPVERSTCRLLAGLDVVSFPVEGSKYRWSAGLEFCILKMKKCSSDSGGSSVSYVALGTTGCLLANSEYLSIQAFTNMIFVEMFFLFICFTFPRRPKQ